MGNLSYGDDVALRLLPTNLARLAMSIAKPPSAIISRLPIALADKEHLICYAVKANSNIAVLQTLAELGAGFDIVSIGELERVLRAGGDPAKVVFSGVAKTASEMQRALELGFTVLMSSRKPSLNCSTAPQPAVVWSRPCLCGSTPMSMRRHIPTFLPGLKENKFGIDINLAAQVYQRAAQMAHINVVGVDCHIGSQLVDIAPFVAALERLLALVDELAQLGITSAAY